MKEIHRGVRVLEMILQDAESSPALKVDERRLSEAKIQLTEFVMWVEAALAE